jgi:adenosylcobinamide-phosphate synthase
MDLMLINIIIAFVLDLFIGDPPFRAHPVRLIGGLLVVLERKLYTLGRHVVGGLLLVLLSLLVVMGVTAGLWYLMPFFTLPLGVNVVRVVLLFFLFCNRDMIREARAVYRLLERGDVDAARRQVGRIVGRDTAQLDAGEIVRATVETVAENTVDGFTAPLFYLLLGDIPLAYGYKTVNTADSLFGYRNERYERFGKAAARLDDALNFIPARLNGLFIFLASGFDRRVLRVMRRDGRLHPSPNSGIAEAGFAAYIGLALGGPSSYGGTVREKPWLGENRLPPGELENPRLILRAVTLYWRVVSVTLIAGLSALSLLGLPLLFARGG